jgi:hypothetical protein
MATENQTVPHELAQRHRTAMMVVLGFFALDLVLLAIAYFTAEKLTRLGDPSIIMALWIGILICGLGAFVLRRTRFATMRLKDVAALRGAGGLIKSLQQTTIQVAVLGGAAGLMGFGWGMLTRDWTNTLRATGVSLVVLVYCFPFRSTWERVVRMLAPSE